MFEVMPVVAYSNSFSGKLEPRYFRDGYAKMLENETKYDGHYFSYWRNCARLEELEETLLFSVKSINSKFVSIGDLLSTIDKKRLYAYVYSGSGDSFCKDVYRYAYVRLGLKKTSTHNLIGVARTFACDGKLLDKWSAYSYSQLCEMLSMSDEERKKVSPDMTIKQIRELKNVLSKNNEIQTSEFEVNDVSDKPITLSKKDTVSKLVDLLNEGYDKFLNFNIKNFYHFAEWLVEQGVKLQ